MPTDDSKDATASADAARELPIEDLKPQDVHPSAAKQVKGGLGVLRSMPPLNSTASTSGTAP